MGCQTEVEIGANLTFTVTAHNQGTGALTDADAVPDYRIYEDETGTVILTGNMAKLDDANTLGFYSELIAATSGNGFEHNKSYSIYITIVVSSVTYSVTYGLVAKDPIEDTIWDEALTGASHNVATSSGRRLRQVESIFVLDTGTAQAGAAGTITLAAGASAEDDFYTHTMIVLTGGTGIGQVKAVEAYNGTTKVATMVPDWVTAPDNTTTYEILADTTKHVSELETGSVVAASFAAGAIDAAAIATGAVDADALAADALAAINAEVDTALNTATPGSPTADSVNQRLAAVDALTEASGDGDLAAIKVQTDALPESIPRNATFTIAFSMVDATDGFTLESGLTVTGTRSIDGASFVSVTGTIAETGSSGIYRLSGVAADSNGTEVVFKFASAGARTKVLVMRTAA